MIKGAITRTLIAVLVLIVASEAFSVQVFQRRTALRSHNRLWSTGGGNKLPDDDLAAVVVDGDEETSVTTPVAAVRDTELGRMARGIARTGMKNMEELQVGDVVVAKYNVPKLDIWANSGYEITDLYSQGVNAETGQVEQIPLATLADADIPSRSSGYTRYMKVYSPKYHSAPVVVTPEEIGLVTLKSELYEAMWLAIPGFFWVFVASSFASNYNEKYGGNFFDAFWRT